MGRLTSTILLVVVLAGLGGYIYFVDSKRPTPGTEARDKVFTVEADAIEEISLKSGGETTTLKKVDGTWKMTAPMQVDADQNEVSTLTSNIASLEVSRVIDENAANLGEYGLATPPIELSYKAAGGGSGQIAFGDKTATQSDLYAVKPGEKRVFVVSAFQESTFSKKSFDLRDKKILNFERDKVDSIEVALGGASAGRPVVAQRQRLGRQAAGAGACRLQRRRRAAHAHRQRQHDQAGRAEHVRTPAVLAKYGLDKPAATVTLGAGSTRATLAFGKEEEGVVYARDQSRTMVFAVEPALATDLKKPADDYRDKDLFEFRNFNADRAADRPRRRHLRVPEGGGHRRRRRQVAARQRPAAPPMPTATKMDDLLSKMTAVRAQTFSAVARQDRAGQAGDDRGRELRPGQVRARALRHGQCGFVCGARR